LFEVARSAGRVLGEAIMYRCHPQTLKVPEVMRSGTIGAVRLIRSSICYRTRRIDDDIRFRADMAGGALMDIGCYCIDFAQLVTGKAPGKISAGARIHESGVDEMAAGSMEFAGGVLSTFTCGMTAAANNTAHICGTEGYIEI